MNEIYKMMNLVLLIKTENNKETFVIAREDNDSYYLITEDGEQLIEDKDNYSIVRVHFSDATDNDDLRCDLMMIFVANGFYFDYLYLNRLNKEKWGETGENKIVRVSKEMKMFFNHLLNLSGKSNQPIHYISRENVKRLEARLNFDLQYIPLIINNGLNESHFRYLQSESDKIKKNLKNNKR